ncbi:MAG: murein L,D-transpeptidase [Chloracidobacterium sp.]|nr:murein L,D-transpeptidase [Chloracidobacterium sp.]
MGDQIQQPQIQGSIRIAGRRLLAPAFALLIVVNAGVARPDFRSPARRSERQGSGALKPKQGAKTLSGPEISEARELLNQLGYWVDHAAKGNDVSMRQALIAFQKIEQRELTGVWTIDELKALRGAQKPRPFETGYPHIEVDLHRQVLFVVDVRGVDLRILPISSASGEFFTQGGDTRQAITPTGRFKVYHKVEGWRKSPLGLLYYPNYIFYGIAIHGNPSVPTRPASHGCIRIPMFAAREFSKIASIGMAVIVYDSDPLTDLNTGEPE